VKDAGGGELRAGALVKDAGGGELRAGALVKDAGAGELRAGALVKDVGAGELRAGAHVTGTETRALRFPAAIFLSAFLLFEVQPMIGRSILPWFGGGPAVWTDCLLFFQVALLAGYGYAHWLGSRSTRRPWIWVHMGLVAASLLFLPMAPRAGIWKPVGSGDPSGRILLLLLVTAGGPYFMLSAASPLLQRWHALSRPGESPYRLYALSNLGALLALLSYPFAVEPFLRLRTQAWMWSGLYAGFAALTGWTAWRLTPAAPAAEGADSGGEARPGVWDILFWMGLAAAGSTLLVATTNQASQGIAVIPFLWVAPLAIYLLTFILAFHNARWYRRRLFACATGVFAPAACAVAGLAVVLPVWSLLGIYLATLLVTCMVCHGELALARPSPRHLTAFYLAVGVGGALGGVFVALVAPRVFTEFSEYPIGLAAACLLGLAGWLRTGAWAGWREGGLGVRFPLMALLLGGMTAVLATGVNGNQTALASWRDFYGILRVKEMSDANGVLRELVNGRVRHGWQYLADAERGWPTAYYGPHSGAGIALEALAGTKRRVAVIGLGTGTLAAWGRPGDSFRFYEIDPNVELAASAWFTFLKDSPARTETVLGDARVQLERELAAGHSGDFEAIAVDAFLGDAIPIHLLTAECAEVYRRRLAPGGLLLLHISNGSLDLRPVARGLARSLGWKAALFVSGAHQETGEIGSTWVLLTADARFLEQPAIADRVTPWPEGGRAPIVWTDDFASLWHAIRF
jgi:hypothetical protein